MNNIVEYIDKFALQNEKQYNKSSLNKGIITDGCFLVYMEYTHFCH